MTIYELHNHLYNTLCIIDDICQKNNVRYFLDSGTEIGSVREKDFIPWDDDMDIKVLLEDYPAFKKAMEKNLPPYMHLIEPNAFSPAFYDFTIRIYDERYHLREETEEDRYYNNYQNYIGTDVFIYAKAPDNKLAQKFLLFRTKILYGLGMAHRYAIKKEKYTFLQKMQVLLLTSIGKYFSVNQICKIFFRLCSKWQSQNTKYYFPINYTYTGNYSRMFDRKIFESTVYGIIRGRKFPIPGGFDQELRQQYGNYQEPPKDNSIYIKHL